MTSALTVERGTSTSGPGVQYTQHALINATNTGSSDFIAYGNNYPGPSNDHGWMDVGYTSDAFNDPAYTITGKNDAYLFGSGANATVGGNLVLSTDYTGSYNDIVIGTGSFFANAEVARFHGNATTAGYLVLKQGTASTSTTTGAMIVKGGLSAAGNVLVGNGSILAIYWNYCGQSYTSPTITLDSAPLNGTSHMTTKTTNVLGTELIPCSYKTSSQASEHDPLYLTS